VKLSEAINQLQEILEEHGDLEMIGASFYGHITPVSEIHVSDDEKDANGDPYGKRVMIENL